MEDGFKQNPDFGDMTAPSQRRALLAALSPFQAPSLTRSLWQILTTLALYATLMTAMYVAYHLLSPYLVPLLAIPAAGLVVRIFIIQHDCGHGSFFRSARANAAVGWLCSLLTFTPFPLWRRHHALHHAVWNNLDKRPGGGDIYSSCMTLAEYQAMSPIRQRLYRLYLHPFVSQLLVPPVMFLLLYRIPFDTPKSWRAERIGVYLTNLAIGGVLLLLAWLLGWQPVLLVNASVIALASIIGVWLFAVQHRFENALWMRQAAWTPTSAALQGSSWLRLPTVLQWFTGNIGFHHVHHLLPRVPNYRLPDCHAAHPVFAGTATALTFRQALSVPFLALWDEASGRMIQFPR